MMRAIQITEYTGPETALKLVEVPEPDPSHPLTPGEGILIDVRAAGVAFPELLQTRGLYQWKPPLPYVPGAEIAGVVRSAPAGGPVRAGDRVIAYTQGGGFAEVAVAPVGFVFPLPEGWEFREGAAMLLNYHTAYFALHTRGGLEPGENVLVHGAAGGIGTAALQLAKAHGARTIAVVSSEAKARIATAAGADEVLRADGPWKDQVRALGGVDLVVDPVGGDRFTDSLRSLNDGGRLLVVGFSEGSIPEVRVNRLLLRNLAVIGVSWGNYALGRPDYIAETAARLGELAQADQIRPIVGASFPLESAAQALTLLEERRAVGKVVLEIA
jgi:NADPH2:quinone reductase